MPDVFQNLEKIYLIFLRIHTNYIDKVQRDLSKMILIRTCKFVVVINVINKIASKEKGL